ncbi:MAG: hypothetical protein QXS69_00185 [Candidatus Aenigmatarchaeota archaeon]
MLSLKDIIFYLIFGGLTFSSIYFSARDNFGNFLNSQLLPTFTKSSYTEPGNYFKILNSTHCVEKILNPGSEIELIVSSNYVKILYKLPNITYLFETKESTTRSYIETSEVSCEKIDSLDNSIFRVRSKNGFYEYSIINGSVSENANGIVQRLNSDSWKCRNLMNQTTLSNIIDNILSTSSCFNSNR